MAVALDSVMPGNAGDGAGGNPASPRTFSFTNTSGTFMVAFVSLGTPSASACTIGAASYNGVALTNQVELSTSGGANGGRIALFYLQAPATGANTFSYAFTSSGEIADSAMCGVATFTGVSSTSPFAQQTTGSGTGTTATANLAGVASGNMTVAGAGAGSSMSAETQTLSYAINVDGVTSLGNQRSSTSTSTGSVTHAFTISASDSWLEILVELASQATPTITVQPVGQVCYVGQTSTFNITATTSGGTLHYQWKKNGGNVGSDQNSYTTPTAVLTDNGATISCVVSDDNGSITSNTVLWNVMNSTPVAWLKA